MFNIMNVSNVLVAKQIKIRSIVLYEWIFDKEILDSNTDMYHVCNSLEFRLKIKKCQSYFVKGRT